MTQNHFQRVLEIKNQLNEAFSKDPYPVTFEEKYSGMDLIWYFEDGGHEYKVHFEKQVGLGKKVFRVMIGQRTSGAKAYKKIISKFKDPFKVIATILAVTETFLTQMNGKVNGLAFGLPLASFGAYQSLLGKVIQRKFMSKIELTDIAAQPPKAEEDGLNYLYTVIKPHSIQNTYDGKWLNGAAGNIVAQGVSTSAATTAVAPSAPVAQIAPMAAAAPNPGATAEFYAECRKMKSFNEFKALLNKYGAEATFSFRKFGGEAFKKGSELEYFPTWPEVATWIKSKITSKDDKDLFDAYAIRQFYYKNPQFAELASCLKTISGSSNAGVHKIHKEIRNSLGSNLLNKLKTISATFTDWTGLSAATKAINPKDFEPSEALSGANDILDGMPKNITNFKLNLLLRLGGTSTIAPYVPDGYKDTMFVNGKIDGSGIITATAFTPEFDAYFKGMDKKTLLQYKIVIAKALDVRGDYTKLMFEYATESKDFIRTLREFEKLYSINPNLDLKFSFLGKNLGNRYLFVLQETMKKQSNYTGATAFINAFKAAIVEYAKNDAKNCWTWTTTKQVDCFEVIGDLSCEYDFNDLDDIAPKIFAATLDSDYAVGIGSLQKVFSSYWKSKLNKYAQLIDYDKIGPKLFKGDAMSYPNFPLLLGKIKVLGKYASGPVDPKLQKEIWMYAPDKGIRGDLVDILALTKVNILSKAAYDDFVSYRVENKIESPYSDLMSLMFHRDDEPMLSENTILKFLNFKSDFPVNKNTYTKSEAEKILAGVSKYYPVSPTGNQGKAYKIVYDALLKKVGNIDLLNSNILSPAMKFCYANVIGDKSLVLDLIKQIPGVRQELLVAVKKEAYSPEYVENLINKWPTLKDEPVLFDILGEMMSGEDKDRIGCTVDEWNRYKSNVADYVDSIHRTAPTAYPAIYNGLPDKAKKLVAKRAIEGYFLHTTTEAFFGDKVPIKPLDKVTPERIREILSYNNIIVPEVQARITKAFDYTELQKRITASPKIDIPNLQVQELAKTPEELNGLAVEYDAFNKGKHGNLGVKFLKVFTVDIPLQREGFEAFVSEHPRTLFVEPCFHGTGSIAASMILRKGFAILKPGATGVVGRALGDGIYFSNVLDKVAQYVSDNGYSRGIGNKGYIFEMQAALGEPRKNYRSAATDLYNTDSDKFVSPEWCVFDGNRQLKIKKAYLIELVDRKEIKKLNVNEDSNVVPINHFTSFLREAKVKPGTKYSGATTYIFMDGTIPLGKDKWVEFEDYKAPNKGVRVEASAEGPMLVINGVDTEAFGILSTRAFVQDEKAMEKFLELIKHAKG